MRVVQRFSALVGWLGLTAIGVFLVLEAIGATTDRWRKEVGDAFTFFGDPPIDQWQAALIGAGLAVVTVIIVIAQLTPYRRTSKYHVVVDQIDEGQTVLHSGAVQTAVGSVIRTVDGVADATVVVGRRRAEANVAVIDDTNVANAASATDGLLDDEFWSRLGIDPMPVDLRFGFQRSPERVIH